jgi:subfamily B ATP-binding cassette protein MsbA
MSKKANLTLDDVKLYKRILVYVKPYWFLLMASLLANMAYSGIDSLVIYSLKPLLDKGFIQHDGFFVKWIPIFIIFAFVARGAMNFLADYSLTYVARSVIVTFRQKLFQKLLVLPASFYDRNSTGNILSTILYNVEQISSASANALTTFVQSGCLVVGMLVVMFTISWKLSLIYLVMAPFMGFLMRYTNKRTRRLSRSGQSIMGDLTSTAEEAIGGYQVVRAFGGQAYEQKKFNKVLLANRTRELKIVITKNLSTSGVQLFSALALSFAVFLAFSHHVALSAGSFAAMIASMIAVLKPLKNMTSVNDGIQRGLTGAQSVFDVLDKTPEKDEGKLTVERVQGRVEYQNINFCYDGVQKNALNEISFVAEPGKTIALVGRSGGGKSTLVKLLPRFYDQYIGKILIDGIDTREYSLKSLRAQTAIVSQHVLLFNDTVKHNIAYGSWAHCKEDDIIEAAKMAHAWEFIKDFPQQLDTLIGENGVLLSGGQRQRIALARAILKNAPILILDEATAALDTESERYIQEALKYLMKNRTTLVIAHRLSTIENADRILVIDDSRIVESGTHQELLSLNQQYAKLHRMQFSESKE